MKKPNIIYILADDMGIGDLGCYGATKIPTPNMDRLAAEGMRFTDAHSSSSVCTPSRYSVLTGKNCWKTRLKKWVIGGLGRPLIEPEQMTLPKLLKQCGYSTYAVGKWHLGFDWKDRNGQVFDFPQADDMDADGFDVDYSQPIGGGPLAAGFDRYFGISGSLDMPPYCFIEDDHIPVQPTFKKTQFYHQQRPGMQAEGFAEEKVDETFAATATAWMEVHVAKEPERPFFLYLATASPHRPCDIAPDFVRGKSQAGDRGDMVVLFDWVVGEVLKKLDELGIADETLVVVTSDNGAQLTCANGLDYGHRANGIYRGQKADIWEGGHREPFLVRWPARVAPGTVCDRLIGLSDMLATTADLQGLETAGEAEDSVSFLPLLDHPEGAPVRDSLIHHSGAGHFSIRKGDHKLIMSTGSGGFSEPVGDKLKELDTDLCRLYNLREDIGEEQNIIHLHPDIANRLRRELAAAVSGFDGGWSNESDGL
jgi:arylsulfatase A